MQILDLLEGEQHAGSRHQDSASRKPPSNALSAKRPYWEREWTFLHIVGFNMGFHLAGSWDRRAVDVSTVAGVHLLFFGLSHVTKFIVSYHRVNTLHRKNFNHFIYLYGFC
jgi:hypothetical protein